MYTSRSRGRMATPGRHSSSEHLGQECPSYGIRHRHNFTRRMATPGRHSSSSEHLGQECPSYGIRHGHNFTRRMATLGRHSSSSEDLGQECPSYGIRHGHNFTRRMATPGRHCRRRRNLSGRSDAPDKSPTTPNKTAGAARKPTFSRRASRFVTLVLTFVGRIRSAQATGYVTVTISLRRMATLGRHCRRRRNISGRSAQATGYVTVTISPGGWPLLAVTVVVVGTSRARVPKLRHTRQHSDPRQPTQTICIQ